MALQTAAFGQAASSSLLAAGNPIPVRVLALGVDPRHDSILGQLSSRQEFRLAHVPLQAGRLESLTEVPADVALVDVPLDNTEDLEAVRRVHAALPGIPLIVLTDTADERVGLRTLKEGAQDCLIKSEINTATLARSIRSAIERQRLQLIAEETRKQQARLKDEFLSHVSHELRSPLTAMDQFLSLLLESIPGDLNAEQREFLEIVARNTGQLRELIDDLLDTTRAETGKLTVDPALVAPSQLMRDAAERYRAIACDRRVLLSAKIPRNLPYVSADPTRARQILSNLLDNACKFTPPGGRIVASVEHERGLSGFLRFSVADTGPGIPADSLPHIFDRLYQGPIVAEGARKGLGLGLHITRELVTRHGGRIWVESKQGVGARFFFTLPIFSVDKLLGPFLGSALAAGKRDFMLVTTVLAPPANSKRHLEEKLLAAAGQTLVRCTLPDVDLSLPRMDCSDRSARFFIIACTNENGARVLSRRIEHQLKALEAFLANGVVFSVSYSRLESMHSAERELTPDFQRSIAAQVESRLQNLEEHTHYER